MKTISLKKVSAVAVAALGFGLLSVVPAQAGNNTSVTHAFQVGGVTATSTTGLVGDVIQFTYVVDGTAASSVTPGVSTFTMTAPADSAAVIGSATAGIAGTLATTAQLNVAASVTASPAVSLTSSAFVTPDLTITPSTVSVAFKSLNVMSIKPDKAGIYTFTATPAATLASAAAKTFTVYVGYSANSTYTNRAFPTQGSNTTTGWAATGGGQATIRITGMAVSSTYFVTTDTGAILSGTGSSPSSRVPVASAVTLTNGTNLGGGFNFVTSAGVLSSDYMDVKVTDTGSPATTTVKVVTYDATTGASSTFVTATVTWGTSAAPSAQYSLLTLNDTNGVTASGAAADTLATIASSSNTGGAVLKYTIQVVVKDQYNVAYTGATLSASIAGTAGSLGISGTSPTAGGIAGSSLSAAMTSSSIGSVGVYSNGVSGAAVVTISATTPAGVTSVLGTKTVTFAGSASKATVTQNLYVAKAGLVLGLSPAATKAALATTVATTPALTAEVMDSNGNDVVAGAVVKITSSDSTVIVAGTCVELSVDADPSTTGLQPAPGIFECPVSGAVGAASGKSATITFSVYSATTGLYSIVATPITFTIGGAISKSVISLDKASYTSGEAMTLLATSTDASGNAAYDGQFPYTSISSNKSLITLPDASTKQIRNGKASTTSSKGVASLFAPSTTGSFTISGLYTDLLVGTAYSATGSVVDGNAALLTQIDALNAKIVALNALIAKIMKKLGVK